MRARFLGSNSKRQCGADYVANRFKASGLEPAGENGSYFQSVPMHEVSVTPEGTRVHLPRHIKSSRAVSARTTRRRERRSPFSR
jgi:hypothetical protein